MAKKSEIDQLMLFGKEPLEAEPAKEEVRSKKALEKETKPAASKATAVETSVAVDPAVAAAPIKRKRGRPPQKLVEQIRAQRRQGVLIPNKMYFAISEVAEICGVKPYVLRYWESEFKLLRPSKNPSGQRMYQKKDIDMVFRIKRCLYEEGFTIAGAKKQLREEKREAVASGAHQAKQALAKIRGELSSLLTTVKK